MRREIAQIAHFLAGFVTTLTSIYLSPIVGILEFVVFIIYELNEDWHISDEAFHDILVYGAGLYMTAIALMLLRWL